jgi:hypothetical protein
MIQLSQPEELPDKIGEFRREIHRCAGGDPAQADIRPRPYSLYLFGYLSGSPDPAGMLEFCYLTDPFRFGGSADTAVLDPVRAVAPLERVLHVGSLAVREGRRTSRVITALCQVFLECADGVNACGFTAASATVNDRSTRFQQSLGMLKLTSFNSAGKDIGLSYFDLADALRRASRWDRHFPDFRPSRRFTDSVTSASDEFRLARKLAHRLNERRTAMNGHIL